MSKFPEPGGQVESGSRGGKLFIQTCQHIFLYELPSLTYQAFFFSFGITEDCKNGVHSEQISTNIDLLVHGTSAKVHFSENTIGKRWNG